MKSLLLVACIAIAPVAIAQDLPKLKPGAWEMTTETDQAAGPPPEMIAKMPPQLQEQMKKAVAAGRAPTRHCVTPNDQDYVAQMQRMGGDVKCKHSALQRSGNTHRWTSTCSGTMPGMSAPFTIESDHAATIGGDTFEHSSVNKRTEGMPAHAPGMSANRTTKTSGRFLGADCKAHGARTMEEMMKEAEGRRERRPR